MEGTLIFAGVITSILVDLFKRSYKLDSTKTLVVLATFSVVLSLLYTWLTTVGWLDTVTQILTVAGSFYAYFIRAFEKAEKNYLQG